MPDVLAEQLRLLVAREQSERRIPSVSACVFRDGEVVWADAIGLADVAAARGELDAAFDRLLEVVRASSGEQRDAARRHLLALLDTIPADDPRAIAARRSLSLALY